MSLPKRDIKFFQKKLQKDELKAHIQLLIDAANEENLWDSDIELFGKLNLRAKFGFAGRGIDKERQIFGNA